MKLRSPARRRLRLAMTATGAGLVMAGLIAGIALLSPALAVIVTVVVVGILLLGFGIEVRA